MSLTVALVIVAVLAVAVYFGVLLAEARDRVVVRRDAGRAARIADAARLLVPEYAALDDRATVLAVLEARP